MRPAKTRKSTIYTQWIVICILVIQSMLSACAGARVILTTPTAGMASATVQPTLTSQPTPTAPPAPSPSPTLTAVPTQTLIPTPTLTLTPTLTPENPGIPGRVTGGDVNLRAGPSRLFPILQTLPYRADLSVLSAAPGREWLQVRSVEGVTGWMKAQYVQMDLAMEAVALAEIPADWITLKGSLKDSSGRPVVSAYVVLYDRLGRSADTRSWEDSYFYLYLPQGSEGTWTLAVLRPTCSWASTNPTCRGAGYFVDNPRAVEISGDQAQSVEVIYQDLRP